MTIRAVSFDFHGTLAVPHPSPGAIYRRIAGDHGVVADSALLDRAFISAFNQVRAARHPAYGADDSDAREFWFAVIRSCFAASQGEGFEVSETLCMALFSAFAEASAWRLMDEAASCVAWCQQQGLQMVICSNFDARLHRLVKGLQLNGLSHVLPSTLVGQPKPDPELLLLAMSLLELEPEEMLHVGDNAEEDGLAAAAAACPWLAVDRQHGVRLLELQRAISEHS